ncbi:efflux RND transporter periplasmic adaptor subunit [Candidiatus Paracoxiella cheracis]|uniref:efflux RND transporter periplasmic adaptor subunit n=1 Tax=Candidiatus Paracoxiella cheracis TaxID=3405120 RepID=UPI003BF50893
MKKRKNFFIIAVTALVTHRFFKHHQGQWIQVRRGPVIKSVYGLGTVTADKVYKLTVGVTSTVQKFYVKEGQYVTKDTPLVALTMLPTIRAPFSGTIISLPLHDNETVYPQTTVLTLMDLKQRYVLVALEQQAAMEVRKGDKVIMNFESLRDKNFTGTVTNIYPKDNNFYVKIDAPDLPEQILPDMTADIAIITNHIDNAVQVPTAAISHSEVTIKNGHQKITKKISIGVVTNGWAQITSDNITPSDAVLIKK